MQPEEKIRRLLEAREALGDRVRLAVALYLSVRGKARFKEVSDGLGISSGNLAHHLRKLEEAGYVDIKKSLDDLRTRILSLTPTGICALAEFLFNLREAEGSQAGQRE